MSSAQARDAEPLDELQALRRRETELSAQKRRLIAEARRRGRSWAEIGEALDVSKQAAWELYNADVRTLLDSAAERSGLTEDEAMRIAGEELAAVREHRRRDA